MGPEEEALHYHANGTPYELPAKEQIEVQYNVKETPIKPPSKNIWDHARRYAQHRVDEQDKDPERLIVNTSFSILGRPDEQHMTSGEYKAYVHAVCAKMVKDNFFPRDKVVLNFWDKLAQNAGYVDFYDLKEKVGNLSPLSFTASHISLGLRSERRDGSYKIGLEEGIAVSDMANSNFGTLLEWMTYSTPLAYENRVGVDVGGEIKYPKDVRAVARHASKTTYPGDFIYSTKNYRDRVVEAVVNGYADRLDRAGYVSVDPETGEKVGSAHGRVRLRVTGGSGKDPFTDRLGRVELTGGSSTPDLVALTARNAMFTLMSVAAYEAVANGSHPVDYFRDKFPNISECDRHIELAHAYNFDGADDPKVSALLAEGKAFLDYMRANYTHPDMKYLADLSELGLNKLFEKTRARNLDEYLNDPRGNISDVITNMYIDGYKPLEIARKIKEFEYKQSKNILNFDGDVLAMELSKRNRH